MGRWEPCFLCNTLAHSNRHVWTQTLLLCVYTCVHACVELEPQKQQHPTSSAWSTESMLSKRNQGSWRNSRALGWARTMKGVPGAPRARNVQREGTQALGAEGRPFMNATLCKCRVCSGTGAAGSLGTTQESFMGEGQSRGLAVSPCWAGMYSVR